MNNFLRIYFPSQMMKKLLSKIFNIIKVDKDCFFVLTANHASLISYHSRIYCRERFFKRDKFPWKPQWSILWHLFTDKSLIILEMQFYWIFITDKSLIFAFFANAWSILRRSKCHFWEVCLVRDMNHLRTELKSFFKFSLFFWICAAITQNVWYLVAEASYHVIKSIFRKCVSHLWLLESSVLGKPEWW